jgi:PEP-CTERM motif
MSVRRPRNAAPKSLERKLATYTIASGAFLAASASSQAQAGIVYSGRQDIAITGAPGSTSYDLNINNAGTDFTFTNTPDDPFSATLTVTSPLSTDQVVLDGSFAAALDAGTLISSASNFGGGNTTTTMGTSSWKGKKDSGPWANAQSLYLGVKFDDPGQTHFGWVQISFPDSTWTATIEGWAYQTDPGVGINAGDTGVAAVPEPSPLVLLALGAAGVGALRRAASGPRIPQPPDGGRPGQGGRLPTGARRDLGEPRRTPIGRPDSISPRACRRSSRRGGRGPAPGRT